MGQQYCEKCRTTMNDSNFYTSKNLIKYPNNGKLNLCKKCLTMHVNNWEPETFLWILEELDLPYIEDEWFKIVKTKCVDPTKVTGTTVLGNYISKMKLNQWKKYGWADTESIKEEQEKIKRLALESQGFNEEKIAEILNDKSGPPPEPEEMKAHREKMKYLAEHGEDAETEASKPAQAYPEVPDYSDLIDFRPEDELTLEDKKKLFLKWGSTYSPSEWIQLEQLYESVMQSFDIQTPTHIDYLKLICKTSLKCNQLIDVGDVDGFQKMSRVYDSLMKSAKFTAAQNKEANGEYVDSVGELIALAEANGPIERYYIDEPKDKVDATLEDMKKYTYRLVTEEQGLGNLIESAIKQLLREDEKQGEDNNEDDGDYDVFEEILTDAELEDFKAFIEEDQERDEDY